MLLRVELITNRFQLVCLLGSTTAIVKFVSGHRYFYDGERERISPSVAFHVRGGLHICGRQYAQIIIICILMT